MLNFLSWLIFVPLQIAFIPLAVVGVAVVAYKQILVSKRLDASQTGIETLNARWTMHMFGMRDDVPSKQLAEAIPNTSVLGLSFCLIPLWVKYKISGTLALYPRAPQEGSETLLDWFPVRTLYIDRILDRAAPDMEQFVLIGSGYDSRAYLCSEKHRMKCFELDRAGTQRLKTDALTKAGIESSHVNFIPVDFECENAFDKLSEAGWDPSRKTLFLFEGVTLYLEEETVRTTLRYIAERAAPGSVLTLDIYAQKVIDDLTRRTRRVLEYTNEALSFGLPFETDFERVLADFIESEDLRLGETFFLGRTHETGPYGVVAEVLIQRERVIAPENASGG